MTTNIKLTADKIDLSGYTTINKSFRVETDGTTHIGPFTVTADKMSSKVLYETVSGVNLYTGFNLDAEQIEYYNERSGANVKLGGNSNWENWEGSKYNVGINITSPNPLMGIHINTPSVPLMVEGGNIGLHPDTSSYVSIRGLTLNTRVVNTTCQLNSNDDIISFTNTSGITVTMPDAYPGKILFIKKYNTATVTLTGGTFMNANDGGTNSTFVPAQHSHILVYDIRRRWIDFYCG